MATFNNLPITPRFNRPSTTGRTLLEFHYIKGGAYVTPYAINSVHIFKDINDGSADNWLDLSSASLSYGLVDPANNQRAEAFFMGLGSGDTVEAENQYAPSSNGIYLRDVGKFGIALEEGLTWDFPDTSASATRTFTNATVGKYWDIWTVQDLEDSLPVTYIHSFELFDSTIISLTEPLMVTTRQKLVQKYINKNSKTDLHITATHTVNNTNITPELKNIFNSTILDNAEIRIIHLKDDTTSGPAYTEILAWTSVGVAVNSDDTVIYNWDTQFMDIGMYELQVKSSFLNQTILSDKFNLVVR
tara:strand:+ start:1978 stop:2883 length:906 start_codon:yes stop_codon:yes gene_type:complete